MAKLVVAGVHKRLGGNPILNGVSLELGENEVVALLGPSGSGKTTLLRAIAGLEVPDQGRIALGDEVLFDAERGVEVPAERRHLGLVFQSYALWPHRTVFENVAYGLKLRKVPAAEIRARVVGTLEQLGLRGLADRHPHQLSGGQRQRVTIARALAPAPKLVILDEAVSALYVSVRNEILVLLDDLKRQEGLTYLLISHDMGAVAQMATDIAVMYLGKVVESGEAARVIREPGHPYTDALLASVPTVSGDIVDPSFRPKGEIGDTAHPPAGCRYHPRCPLAIGRCSTEEPLIRLVRDRLTACHRAEELGVGVGQ
jgi:iron(III) transport system ATP-binding protein